MLFQGGALFDSLPVWQNVAFRLQRGPQKRPKAEAREIAIEKLRRVGLKPDVADLFPSELSGGMQKRVGLARAIAAEPEIIFFDEPTTGLDPIMSGVINDLIREIVTEMGATALTITHDMRSVRAIADKVAMLHEGVIRWHGPVAEIDTADDPYLRQFVTGAAEGPIAAVRLCALCWRSAWRSAKPIAWQNPSPNSFALPAARPTRNGRAAARRVANGIASRKRRRCQPVPARRRWVQPRGGASG